MCSEQHDKDKAKERWWDYYWMGNSIDVELELEIKTRQLWKSLLYCIRKT